jgi:hypothetical protein
MQSWTQPAALPHWIRGWVGPDVGLDVVKTPAGNRASILASQSIRYTEGSRHVEDIRRQELYKFNFISVCSFNMRNS